jgi:hypothetical protein
VLALVVAPLVSLKVEHDRSECSLAEHTENWRDYINSRVESDEKLLREDYAINLADSGLLKIYGFE